MAYEYESKNISRIMHYTNLVDSENVIESYSELREVYRKAKAFDEVKEFVDKKVKEEEEIPRNLLDDYDYGLNQAYNHVDDIIQEHMESADDER